MKVLASTSLTKSLPVSLVLFWCVQANASESLKKARMVALSQQQAQFAGYYMAVEKGTLQHTVQGNPGLVENFVHASFEGWAYAFAHPEETIDVMLRIMKAAHLPANRVQQRWMLARMQDLMHPPSRGKAAGELSRQDCQLVSQALYRQGLIRSAIDDQVFVKAPHALP